MRVSLINLNLVAEDAIGTCIMRQVRFFQRRGDEVHICVLHPPHNVPADIKAITSVVTLGDLIGGGHTHFRLSDLYIYHYPGRHELMESIRGIDRGTVILEGKMLVHYADLCITDSPFNKQDLVEQVGYDADRIHVLPLAVPMDQFTPGDRDPQLVQRLHLEGQRILLFVGRMAGNKRIDLLVQALAWVKRQEPTAKLLLVGDDSSSPAYRQVVAAAKSQANQLGIAEDVIWTGPVDDILPYLRLADVYVTASLHEGFGVPLIEAMACGVPVVASRAGAMPWVLDEAGLLFEPGNADELAEQVLQVLRGGELRQTLIGRGLQRVEAFSLEKYETALTEIVDQAVSHTLPRASLEPTGEAQEEETTRLPYSARSEILLNVLADEIDSHSDIMLRDYQVHSRAPLVGPLIAWVRRNLTSHLREPYLDPTLEKQVDLNRRIADWMRRAATLPLALGQRQNELEARVKALEAQVEDLLGHLDEKPGKEL
jgi:glycosyltransferase involved in cell wall biosynthesis